MSKRLIAAVRKIELNTAKFVTSLCSVIFCRVSVLHHVSSPLPLCTTTVCCFTFSSPSQGTCWLPPRSLPFPSLPARCHPEKMKPNVKYGGPKWKVEVKKFFQHFVLFNFLPMPLSLIMKLILIDIGLPILVSAPGLSKMLMHHLVWVCWTKCKADVLYITLNILWSSSSIKAAGPAIGCGLGLEILVLIPSLMCPHRTYKSKTRKPSYRWQTRAT